MLSRFCINGQQEQEMDINCQNCGNIFTGKYCNECGQSQEVKRIDKDYAFQELLNVIGLEKGFIFTCGQLLRRPGSTIQEYIHKNRHKVVKPVTFLILTSVIYTLISQYFYADNPYSEFTKKVYGDSSLTGISNWIKENYGYANLLMILPITLWTRRFFKKYNYNFFETVVVISFVMGIGMLIFSLEPIINKLSPDTFLINETITIIIAFIYMSWAIGQFYERKIKNYIKGFLAYSFGFLTFQIVVALIAVIYDSIMK